MVFLTLFSHCFMKKLQCSFHRYKLKFINIKSYEHFKLIELNPQLNRVKSFITHLPSHSPVSYHIGRGEHAPLRESLLSANYSGIARTTHSKWVQWELPSGINKFPPSAVDQVRGVNKDNRNSKFLPRDTLRPAGRIDRETWEETPQLTTRDWRKWGQPYRKNGSRDSVQFSPPTQATGRTMVQAPIGHGYVQEYDGEAALLTGTGRMFCLSYHLKVVCNSNWRIFHAYRRFSSRYQGPPCVM